MSLRLDASSATKHRCLKKKISLKFKKISLFALAMSLAPLLSADFFLGGVGKTKVLEAFRPHIYFDDQDVHLEAASRAVPSGKVPALSLILLRMS